MAGSFYYRPVDQKIYDTSIYRRTDAPGFKPTQLELQIREPTNTLGSNKTFEEGFNYGSIIDSILGAGKKGDSSLEDDFQFNSGAQKAKDFLENKIGKNIAVKRVPLAVDQPGLGGFFMPEGIGGSADPTQRGVYLKPDSSYTTFFHEVGHAADPELLLGHERKQNFGRTGGGLINSLNTPEKRLNYLFENTEKPTVKAEAEAQSFAARNIPGFARANPNLNINYQQEFDRPWFKEYPASYGSKAIDDFYKAELGNRYQEVVEEDVDRGVATRVFKPDITNYVLNPALEKEEKAVKDWTRNYVDTRLNQFQSEPTPAALDYFAPRN